MTLDAKMMREVLAEEIDRHHRAYLCDRIAYHKMSGTFDWAQAGSLAAMTLVERVARIGMALLIILAATLTMLALGNATVDWPWNRAALQAAITQQKG